MVRNGHEVHVGEVEGFRRTVHDRFSGKESMEVHLSQADGMTFVVGASDGWHTRDVRMFRHRGQCANRTFHSSSQITVHRLAMFERSKIAGHVTSHVIVGQTPHDRCFGSCTWRISEHRLLMAIRPSIGLARFTVSSNTMYGYPDSNCNSAKVMKNSRASM